MREGWSPPLSHHSGAKNSRPTRGNETQGQPSLGMGGRGRPQRQMAYSDAPAMGVAAGDNALSRLAYPLKQF